MKSKGTTPVRPTTFPSKASTPSAKRSAGFTAITLPSTDNLAVDEESQEHNHIDLVLQIQNLEKALKQMEKHYEFQLNKNRKNESVLQRKDQEIIRLRQQGIEAYENVTKLKETIDNVNEDNTMLRDIIVEANQRIQEIQEENQQLSKKIKQHRISSPETDKSKSDEDSIRIEEIQLPDHNFIFDSFSFRKPAIKPNNSGSTRSKEHDSIKVPTQDLTLTDFEQVLQATTASGEKEKPNSRNHKLAGLTDSFVLRSDHMDEDIVNSKNGEKQ